MPKQPSNARELREAIVDRFEQLSPRLQQIGRYILDDPDSAGVETLSVISKRAGTPPSAIVRFAQTFGFDGAAAMQRLMKDELLAQRPETEYHRRARLIQKGNLDGKKLGPLDFLEKLAVASVLSIDHMRESIDSARFEEAVNLIRRADAVHVAGFRRSFPVAAYLAYSLQRSGRNSFLLDGAGGMGPLQASRIRPGDILLGVSFAPYADEMLALTQLAAKASIPIMMITDSLVGSISRHATCILQVRETEVQGFRSLAAPMCLAQSLAISLALEFDEAKQ